MTLAKMARILLDPRAILEKKACHDLAHVLVDATRRAQQRETQPKLRRAKKRH